MGIVDYVFGRRVYDLPRIADVVDGDPVAAREARLKAAEADFTQRREACIVEIEAAYARREANLKAREKALADNAMTVIAALKDAGHAATAELLQKRIWPGLSSVRKRP